MALLLSVLSLSAGLPTDCPATTERLPTTVTPVAYNLTLRPATAAGTFSGSVDILAKTAGGSAPLDCVTLHAGANLTIAAARVNGVALDVKAQLVRNTSSEMLTLQLKSPVSGDLRLRFEFHSVFHESVGSGYPPDRGLYRIPVSANNSTRSDKDYMAIAESWAVEARNSKRWYWY